MDHEKYRAGRQKAQRMIRTRMSADERLIAENLREILLQSSRSQLMSDVPIALFLSGGVDSAVIGALMRSVGAEQLTPLTIGFEEESFDESQPSRRTAASNMLLA